MAKSLVFLYLFQILAGFVWPSVRVWKRTGVNPYVLSKEDGIEGLIARWFRIVLVLTGVVVALPWIGCSVLLRSAVRESPFWLQITGMALLLLSLGLMLWAQGQMSDSWRIGLDRNHGTALRTHGIFSYSRNPVFLSMRLQLLGIALVLPGAGSVLALVLGDLCMQMQVRLEEAFLRSQHGAEYEEYCAKVRRWA